MQLSKVGRSLHSALLARSQQQASVRSYNVAPLRVVKTQEKATVFESDEKEDFVGPDLDVNAADIAALLVTLTSETEIAQLHLTMGSFQLKVRRNVQQQAAAPAAAPPPTVPPPSALAQAPHMAPASLAAVPNVSLVEVTSAAESIDESLVPVQANKVGVFRRGKYAGGKKVAKGNVADVGLQVKKGQILGYIEQLGTFVEIKAPAAGEVAAYNAEEGDPVEYQQVLVQIAPSFGVEEAGVTQHRL